jgi:transcriptional regulator with GAF, ATPase, and Fis domain
MPAVLQAKILRVLTDGQIVRVGSTASRSIDVRLVLATHRDLAQRVREGQFREDLFYRIAVVPITMPPLRDRIDDLPLLIEPFLARAAVQLDLPHKKIGQAAMDRLRCYVFPGNVRELRNLIERACILAAGDTIGPEDLPLTDGALDATHRGAAGTDDLLGRYLATLPQFVSLRAILEDMEWRLMQRALAGAQGVQAEAARRLGLSRSDMTYKLRRRRDGDGAAADVGL